MEQKEFYRDVPNNSFHRAALCAIERQWSVIPLVPGSKRPAIKEWERLATTDAAQVTAWWSQWPDANIGIACGRSGLLVVDADMKSTDGTTGVQKWLDMCGEIRTPPTFTVSTPSGGLHAYYQAPAGSLRNSAGRLGPGIDTRAGGGYVVAAGSVIAGAGQYDVTADMPVAEAPQLLIEMLMARVRRGASVRPSRASRVGQPRTEYGLAAFERVCGRLACAPETTRNDTLNACAFDLGRLVAAGLVDSSCLGQLHFVALRTGLDEAEVMATIRSGFSAGTRIPWRSTR